MAEYYYLTASLPLLSYSEEAFLDPVAFRATCREQMSQGDFNQLDQADLGKLPGEKNVNPVLRQWQRWESALRNALVRFRAQTRKKHAEDHLVSSPEVLGLEDLAREAYAQGSPLVAEDLLNRSRWAFLEELGLGHYFDLENLILYSLKLQILQRRRQFRQDAGTQRYQEIYQEVTGGFESGFTSP